MEQLLSTLPPKTLHLFLLLDKKPGEVESCNHLHKPVMLFLPSLEQQVYSLLLKYDKFTQNPCYTLFPLPSAFQVVEVLELLIFSQSNY